MSLDKILTIGIRAMVGIPLLIALALVWTVICSGVYAIAWIFNMHNSKDFLGPFQLSYIVATVRDYKTVLKQVLGL